MSQKKRVVKPIQIALTEDQIARIIQEAARNRPQMNVQSLEDRIAPSRFGLPVFGGAEDAFDPNIGDNGGDIPHDPSNPFAPHDPMNPGADGTTVNPDVPHDPANPYAPYDPNAGGDGTTVDGGAPLPGDLNQDQGPYGQGQDHTGPGGPNSPIGNPDNPRDRDFGNIHGSRTVLQGNPDDPRFSQRFENMMQQRLDNIAESGGEMPSEEDLANHRRNILRNLRGWDG